MQHSANTYERDLSTLHSSFIALLLETLPKAAMLEEMTILKTIYSVQRYAVRPLFISFHF